MWIWTNHEATPNFIKKFNVYSQKDKITPEAGKKGSFLVLFYGKYLPLNRYYLDSLQVCFEAALLLIVSLQNYLHGATTMPLMNGSDRITDEDHVIECLLLTLLVLVFKDTCVKTCSRWNSKKSCQFSVYYFVQRDGKNPSQWYYKRKKKFLGYQYHIILKNWVVTLEFRSGNDIPKNLLKNQEFFFH